MSDRYEVTHREILDRLIQVEQKVIRIDENTSGMVTAFKAAEGAFAVLEFLAKLAKPVLWITGLCTAVAVAWDQFKVR